MTDLMLPIYDSIPGHREARDSLRALDDIPVPVTSGALTPAHHLATDVLAHLADGKPLDLLARAEEAMTEVGRVETARQALVRAREQLEARMRELKASNPDVILTGLNDALGSLVDEVTALQPLREITTEAGAIDSDRTKDYKRLREITPRYSLIRREQLRIMKDQTGGNFPIPEALFSPNLREHFPLWAPWRSHGHLVHEQANRLRDIRPPWPVPGDLGLNRGDTSQSRTTFQKDASEVAFMLWAIENGIELWVPTLEQYATTARQYHDALAREHRTELIDQVWRDPGGIDLGTPSRSIGRSAEARKVDFLASMADR